MRENEFDNGVKELMGEFRLQPSAEVWPEVERRIRERRKRRILFFWFFSAAVLLGGAGTWWLLQQDGKTDHNQVLIDKQKAVPEKSMSSDRYETEAVNEKATGTNHGQTGTVQNADMSMMAPVEKKAAIRTTGNDKLNTISGLPVNKGRKLVLSERKNQMNAGKQYVRKANNSSLTNKKGIAKADPVSTSIAPAVNSNPAPVPVGSVVHPDSPISTPVPADAVTAGTTTDSSRLVKAAKPVDTVIAVVVPEAPAVKKSAKNKWETGFIVAGGITRLTSGKISGFGMAEKNFDQVYSSPVSSNSSYFNNSPLVRYADTIPLYGWAWQAGVYASRKIKKRTSFSAGLNIGFYSSWQTVGAFKDSSRVFRLAQGNFVSGSYYLSGTENKYSNRYYYLQFPLLFHWQLNKARKGPALQWENGLLPVWLAGSRAIIYDRTDRMYYIDKKAYHQFGLAFQTGMTVQFSAQQKKTWSAGVYYNFHFSQLQKNNQPAYNNLSSFGIQFRRGFKK